VTRPRGTDRPRWRAKTRHRFDRDGARTTATSTARDELSRWLGTRAFDKESIDALEALDLTAYLRDTAHIAIDAGERLRQLAIAVETRLATSAMPRGFLALERIYTEVRGMGAEQAETSFAIGAHSCVELGCDDVEGPVPRAILAKAEQAAHRAIAARDDDANAHYMLGSILYKRGDMTGALAAFTDATKREAKMGWAELFRAHCLHDLKRWEEAAAAYDVVDASAFDGPTAWRWILSREQRAACLLMAGRRDEALSAFDAVLTQYEREPHRMQGLHTDLEAAAKGELAPELGARVAALFGRLDWT
jgi:tetratricopeptide (TPR) repeat protein